MLTIDDALPSHVAAVVDRLLREAGMPGAAVALVVDGQPLVRIAVGRRDPGRTAPLEPTAQFYAYSITKTVLAIAALRLVERGRLDLDASLPLVAALLPEAPFEPPVTLRRLLNHTAGLPDYGAMPDYGVDPGAIRGRPGPTTGSRPGHCRAGSNSHPVRAGPTRTSATCWSGG